MKIVSKPIEMVAWFTMEGRPTPVKFRLQNEDGTLTVIRVDKILFKDMEKLAGNSMLVFRCRSLIKNIDTVYELKYELSTMRWILFKI